MRRTKIVCTLGPATSSAERIRTLIEAGMDVARLNFSHAEHADRIRLIREQAAALNRPVAILQDLSGPKVRIGMLAEEHIHLEPGQAFVLTARDVPGDATEVGLSYKALPRDVHEGDRLLLNDGALELRVLATDGTDMRCEVVVGGPLSSRKGITLPDSTLTAKTPTEKDCRDLAFGLEQGVDLVAVSFVRGPDDIEAVRARIREAGLDTPIIAKIEKHEALGSIDAIVAAADGLMVARGDLGVEVPIHHVPGIQKLLTDKANSAGKPVITATQMLESMVDNPRPTRTEVTDVANAILDGSDAVMLSAETAVGAYPVEAVRMMTHVADDIETVFPIEAWQLKVRASGSVSIQEAVAREARDLADSAHASAILTCTQSGSTTRLVSKYLPRVPVLALTPSGNSYRRP